MLGAITLGSFKAVPLFAKASVGLSKPFVRCVEFAAPLLPRLGVLVDSGSLRFELGGKTRLFGNTCPFGAGAAYGFGYGFTYGFARPGVVGRIAPWPNPELVP